MWAIYEDEWRFGGCTPSLVTQVDAIIGGERRHVDEHQAHNVYEYQDVRSAGCLTRARIVVERCLYMGVKLCMG
jgi:hypothetical protein